MFRPPLQNGHGQRWTAFNGVCPESPGMLELVRYQRTVFEYGGTGDYFCHTFDTNEFRIWHDHKMAIDTMGRKKTVLILDG